MRRCARSVTRLGRSSVSDADDELRRMMPDDDRRDDALLRLGAFVLRPLGTLTVQEATALAYASVGLTNQMIGDAMGYAHGSAKDFLTSARAKLRAKNTTHACCLAIRQRLIP